MYVMGVLAVSIFRLFYFYDSNTYNKGKNIRFCDRYNFGPLRVCKSKVRRTTLLRVSMSVPTRGNVDLGVFHFFGLF